MVNPSRTSRISKLTDRGRESDIGDTTAAERIGMMWQLTLDAWAFVEGVDPDTPMRRDVVRVVR